MDRRDVIDNPDLIDAIIEFVTSEFPQLAPRALEMKEELRREFSGSEIYIRRRSVLARQQLTENVLRMFNGRNATEVARRLNIGRATVYRIIKQAGQSK